MNTTNSAASGEKPSTAVGPPSDTWRKDANDDATAPLPDAEMKRAEDATPTAAKTLQQNLGTPALIEPVTEPGGKRQKDRPENGLSTERLGPTVDDIRDHDFPVATPEHARQNTAVADNQRSGPPGYFEEGGAVGTKPGDSQPGSTVGAIMDQAETTPDLSRSVDGVLE